MNADELLRELRRLLRGEPDAANLRGCPPKLFLGGVIVGTLLVAALALSGARLRIVGIAFVIVTLVAYVLGLSDPAFRRAEVFSLLTRALYALLAALFVALLALATWP